MLRGLCFHSSHPLLSQNPQGSPVLVDGGAAASPGLGGGGTGGKGPIGGHSGNMPGGKGGRRPWGTAEKGWGGEKRSKLRHPNHRRGASCELSLLP